MCHGCQERENLKEGVVKLDQDLLSETVGVIYKAENKAGLQVVMDREGGKECEY